jgi:NNP family nitrate/nitrite transporter-like MFS transporter
LRRFIKHNADLPSPRAFHCSWWVSSLPFFIWFAIAPLLSEIRDDLSIWDGLHLSWCRRYHPDASFSDLCGTGRILFAAVLCTRLHFHRLHWLCEDSAWGLLRLFLFIGMAGGTFVMCQYWTSRMFYQRRRWNCSPRWRMGNLGGVTQLVMGSLLFPL